MVKVYNMTSARSGRPVANQYIIGIDFNTKVFQSYGSTIAVYDRSTGTLTLGKYFDYSRTTARYLHEFIRTICTPDMVALIADAPGSSYSAKLRYCIDRGDIKYEEAMI